MKKATPTPNFISGIVADVKHVRYGSVEKADFF